MPEVLPDERPRRLVLASGNRGKLAELRSLLARLDVQVLAQDDLGIGAAAEPHATFLENALVKARHAASLSGLPALADDSGLCCDALGGLPGVRSARFAGEHATDDQNNQALIDRLRGVGQRAAHFSCVIVAVRSADDPEPLVAQGRWRGLVVDTAQGEGGFGYDAYFWVPVYARTAAQLTPDEKNRLSHRGQAMRRIKRQLQTAWGWA